MEIKPKGFGEGDLAVAKTLTYVGSELRDHGKYNEALEKLNKAL